MHSDQIIDRLIETSNEGGVSDVIASLTYEDLRSFMEMSTSQAHRLSSAVPMAALKKIAEVARLRMAHFRNLMHDQ